MVVSAWPAIMVGNRAGFNPVQLPTGAHRELVTAPDLIAAYAVHTGATARFEGIFMTTRRHAKSAARWVAGWLCWFGLAGNRPAATHFLLLRQNKVSKEKATLLSASLRCATGSLRYSLQAGSAQTRLRLKQRAALIRLKLRSSAQTEGLGSECEFGSPYGSFSPWDKAGMRASGGRTPAGFCFQAGSPHPSLLPKGEGGIQNPPPVLAGPVMTGKNGIRAARCLSVTK